MTKVTREAKLENKNERYVTRAPFPRAIEMRTTTTTTKQKHHGLTLSRNLELLNGLKIDLLRTSVSALIT